MKFVIELNDSDLDTLDNETRYNIFEGCMQEAWNLLKFPRSVRFDAGTPDALKKTMLELILFHSDYN